jgi:Ca2+-binding EF-hand superfamily protein
MMVKMASSKEVGELRTSFMAIDTDGSGQISA